MSDCNIRNFKSEPLLTLHARIHILPLVDIMLQYLSKKKSSKKSSRFLRTREKGFDLSFSRFAVIVLQRKCYLDPALNPLTCISL